MGTFGSAANVQRCRRHASDGGEQGTCVGNVKAEGLHQVKGKARHVYCAPLRVCHRHAVVSNGGVSGTNAAHTYCLQSARTSIIAQVNSSKVAQGCSNVRCARPAQGSGVKTEHGDRRA